MKVASGISVSIICEGCGARFVVSTETYPFRVPGHIRSGVSPSVMVNSEEDCLTHKKHEDDARLDAYKKVASICTKDDLFVAICNLSPLDEITSPNSNSYTDLLDMRIRQIAMNETCYSDEWLMSTKANVADIREQCVKAFRMLPLLDL